MNSVILIGRITKDCELRYIPDSGIPVILFTIAVSRNYTKKDGTKETDFIPVEMFGKGKDKLAEYLVKGKLISIQGSIQVDRYKDKDGKNRIYTKVRANHIEFLGNNNHTPLQEESIPTSFQAIDDSELPF